MHVRVNSLQAASAMLHIAVQLPVLSVRAAFAAVQHGRSTHLEVRLPPALKAWTACVLQLARSGMNAPALAARRMSSSAALMLRQLLKAEECVLLRVGAVLLLHSRRPPSNERAKNLRRERKILQSTTRTRNNTQYLQYNIIKSKKQFTNTKQIQEPLTGSVRF
eukprot:15366-Heterococcus_DN1.PRE.2